ncbi:MAG TPA: hypothetical protein VIH16_07490 [Bellilinea sp.]
MRTPAGTECRYFYGNYFRGKNQEECRLIGNQPPPGDWNRNLCQTCPVPEILRANACEFLTLHGEVKRTLGVFRKRVIVSASCTKSKTNVAEPHVGCGQCHPIPPVFTKPEP